MEKLNRQGKTHAQIAEDISAQRSYSLSRQQIVYDLKQLQTMWEREAILERTEAVAKELSQIAVLQRIYYDAWEVSSSESAGNPAFLTGIMSCIERRCKLLGLDAPTRIANTDPSGNHALPVIVLQPGMWDII